MSCQAEGPHALASASGRSFEVCTACTGPDVHGTHLMDRETRQ